ncbi:uncharacterized protein M421DRAFT_61823 [Didymella exigua CBS 183.55]|uniref:Uncharacterized protein n=1 Tax=Didymella exigua CBS 183.55 TaxID=1150837 RepID=A0A6A5RNX4_9PLEO|nr:uncharacterized protein M421DRAFT_61823 [Didymella exigua CBS 183.55]KAF1929133.1 hypothetical protein M421DRAFT_61823 [Didymella exigua CBS 183.55]
MVPLRRPSQRGRRSLEHDRDPFEWQEAPDTPMMTATFPIHPLPSMQAAFEESMLDATGETGFVPFKTPGRGVKTRQQLLCREADAEELSYNYTYSCHRRHHPKRKHHPLLKTIAQIVFGVHLLHQHLEKSTADVADILLKHVNELDSFLQRANEDLEQSLKDMLFRHKCLRVPMEHVNEFDRLLDDRAYRASLLDGNITIERTINRMSHLLNDYLIDISIYRDANQELELYLRDIGDEWAYRNEDVGRIYSAMCGNTSGWAQFLQSLVTKAERLGTVLVQVSSYCNEIEKRCGAASRRSLPEYHHEAWHSEEQRKAAAQPQTEPSRTSHKHGHRRSSQKEGDSPPMTAKDSAYSSLSGASIVSPASTAPPRSASSSAQFGLFPSSARHTPKQSMSGKFGGAATPSSSNLRSVKSAEPPDRPPTSTSVYSETTSKRLLKRSSLQSLRRFFTKKKNDIHTIAE